MANLAIIQAQRYADGKIRDCIYLGSIQDDGWVYFNDDIWWRSRIDKSNVQLFYISKEIWVSTSNLEISSISTLNATQAQNIINGGGSAATNANIETAVKWAIQKVSSEWITYSQTYRNLKNPNGDSYDCSSFIITAMYVGGFDANAITTYNMKQAFIDLGFTWIAGNYFPSSDCLRGDILLKEQDPYGHTQMYIGNGQDVNCGGTPAAIITHSPDNFGRGYGWDGILRYTG